MDRLRHMLVGALLVGGASCVDVGDAWLVERALGEDVVADTVGITPPSGPLSYDEHIVPILEDHGCVICHDDAASNGGYSVTTATALVAGGKTGAAVTPCSKEDSFAWERVVSCAMPPGSNCLDALDILTLGRWIDQGAQAVFDDSVCADPPLD